MLSGLNSQKNPLRSVWKVDPNRPIYSALLEAELQRLDIFFDEKLTDTSHIKNQEDANVHLAQLLQLAQEGVEILEWIFTQQPLTDEQALNIAVKLKDQNVPQIIWKSILVKAGKKSKGRPITKRQVAIQALEKRLLDSSRSWSNRELAQQFCNCDKEKHDEKCSQSLRQTIIQLRKILAKYCPDLTL